MCIHDVVPIADVWGDANPEGHARPRNYCVTLA